MIWLAHPGIEVPGEPPESRDAMALGDGAHQTFMRVRGAESIRRWQRARHRGRRCRRGAAHPR